MANQNAVYQTPPLGEVGGLATTNYVNPLNAVPGCRVNGAAQVGGFVWATSAPSGTNPNSMEQFVTNSAASGSPVGFVYRVQDQALPCASGYTQAIADGQACPVADGGCFFATPTTSAVVGQKVFAALSNGAVLQTASAGATVSGYVETNFTVKTPASSGGIMVIEAK